MTWGMSMSNQIQYIPLDRILTDFQPKITVAFNKRMKKTHEEWLEYDLLLAVEVIPERQGYYRLVGGFDRHFYFKNFTESKVAPCLVEEATLEVKRHLKILNRLFNKGDTTKPNRVILLRKLEAAKVMLTTIVKKTGFTRSQLVNDYKYDENIPIQHRSSEASITTLNWIASLKKLRNPIIDNEIIEFLYERANETNAARRLSLESVNFLKKLFTSKRSLFELSISDQKKILNRAINFKGSILEIIKKDIDNLLLLTPV